MSHKTHSRMEQSSDYLHSDTCGLESPDHQIDIDHVTVLQIAENKLEEQFDLTIEFAATGCNSCYEPDADGAFYWVAQGKVFERGYEFFGYSIDTVSFDDVMDSIESAADMIDVPFSRPPNEHKKFVLGTDMAYTSLDAGTRVSRKNLDMMGTVVDPSIVDQTLSDGDNIVQFDDGSVESIPTVMLDRL